MQLARRLVQAPSYGPAKTPRTNGIPQEVIDVLSALLGEIVESLHDFGILPEFFLLPSDSSDYLSRFGFVSWANIERAHVVRKVVESSMDIEAIWIDATLHWLVIVNTASQGPFSVHQEAASTVFSPKTNTHFAGGEVDDWMLMARHNLVQPDEQTRRETKARGQPPYIQMRQIDCEFLTAFAMTFQTESFWHWGPCSLLEMDSERFKESPRLEPGRFISRSAGNSILNPL